MRGFIFFLLITLVNDMVAQKVEVVKSTPKAILGEGSIWHPEENVLYWVDITGEKLHRYDPQKEENRTFKMGSMIGTVVPAKGKYPVVVALEAGIHGVTPEGKLEKLSDYPENEIENNRFNDGKCDPAGRFWVGSMNKKVVKEAGNLYSFDGKNLEVKQSGVTISNGIVWSTDAKIMYYIDTPEYAIFAYDYDKATGSICNRRVAVKIPEDAGAPDGMTIDAEGMLWVAHWGGCAVIRWNPETGKMIRKIDVPAPHVTSCTFGGDDLQTLYITTASEGLTDEQYADSPLSGSLFAIKVGVKGVVANMFQSLVKIKSTK